MSRAKLTMMDAALVAQTMRGRPMTTHHVLECGRPVAIAALERAVEHIARAHPVLRSHVRERAFRLDRIFDPVDDARARSCLVLAALPAELESSGWVDWPFDLETEWPFRVRLGETPRGTFTLCLTLHQSVTDGVGALMLFDELLAAILHAERGEPVLCSPRRAWSSDENVSAWREIARRGPRFARALTREVARHAGRFWHRRADLLDLPEERPRSFGVRLRHLRAADWSALEERANALGVTRNDLINAAALRSASRARLARGKMDGRPWRLLGAVDLRRFFFADAPRSNWIGTLEVDLSQDEIDSPGLERTLHARLTRARRPEHALVTPVLLGLIGGALPPSAFRRVLRASDAPGGSHPYSLFVSRVRPGEERCWPRSLEPLALWCTSTLPRKPGVGLTITTAGDQATIAACWPKPLVHSGTIDLLLDGMLRELVAEDPPELDVSLLGVAASLERIGIGAGRR